LFDGEFLLHNQGDLCTLKTLAKNTVYFVVPLERRPFFFGFFCHILA
jgi:hypothetical protein